MGQGRDRLSQKIIENQRRHEMTSQCRSKPKKEEEVNNDREQVWWLKVVTGGLSSLTRRSSRAMEGREGGDRCYRRRRRWPE